MLIALIIGGFLLTLLLGAGLMLLYIIIASLYRH